ncbi:MAG: hypothetical protein ACI9S8_003220 [Chlamydiales bacterium]|jgi:hypothetical protein
MKKNEQISKELQLNRAGMTVVMTQVKALQGSFSLFKQFEEEIVTMKKQLQELEKSVDADNVDLKIPKRLNVFTMARGYHNLIANPHPYPHHLLEIADSLGAQDNIYLKINILERFLHAVDKVDPHFYQNPLHKQEVRKTIMSTLEDLYDKLEEIEEEAEIEEQERLMEE